MESAISTPIVRKMNTWNSEKTDDRSSVTSGYSTCTDNVPSGEENSLKAKFTNTNAADNSVELMECYSSSAEEDSDDCLVDEEIPSPPPVLMRNDAQDEILNSEDHEIFSKIFNDEDNEIFKFKNGEIFNNKDNIGNSNNNAVPSSKDNGVFSSKDCFFNNKDIASFNSQEDAIPNHRDNEISSTGNNSIANNKIDVVSSVTTKDGDWLDCIVEKSEELSPPTLLQETTFREESASNTEIDSGIFSNIVECSNYYPDFSDMCNETYSFWELPDETNSAHQQNHTATAHCSQDIPYQGNNYSASSYAAQPSEIVSWPSSSSTVGHEMTSQSDTVRASEMYANSCPLSDVPLPSISSAFSLPAFPNWGQDWNYSQCDFSGVRAEYSDIEDDTWPSSDEYPELLPVSSQGSTLSTHSDSVYSSSVTQTLPSYIVQNVPLHSGIYLQSRDFGSSSPFSSDAGNDLGEQRREFASTGYSPFKKETCATPASSGSDDPSKQSSNTTLTNVPQKRVLLLLNNNSLPQLRLCGNNVTVTPMQLLVNNNSGGSQTTTLPSVAAHNSGTLLRKNGSVNSNVHNSAPCETSHNDNLVVDIADSDDGSDPNESLESTSHTRPDDNKKVFISKSSIPTSNQSESNKANGTFTTLHWMPSPISVIPISQPMFPLTSSSRNSSASAGAKKLSTDNAHSSISSLATSSPLSVDRRVPGTQTYHQVTPLTFRTRCAPPPYIAIVKKSTVNAATTCGRQQQRRKTVRELLQEKYQQMFINTLSQQGVLNRVTLSSPTTVLRAYNNDESDRNANSVLRPRVVQFLSTTPSVVVVENPKGSSNSEPQSSVASNKSEVVHAVSALPLVPQSSAASNKSEVDLARAVSTLPLVPQSSVASSKSEVDLARAVSTLPLVPQSSSADKNEVDLARAVSTLPLVPPPAADKSASVVNTPADSSSDGGSNSRFLVTSDREEANPPDLAADNPIGDKSVVCELLELPPFRMGRVDAKEHRPRHYDLIHLQIGDFTITASQDHAVKIHNKFKVLFTKRQFTYEFPIPSSSPLYDVTGRLQVACVVVPFKIVSAMKCDNNVVNIQVDCQPSIYLGARQPRIGIIANATVYDTSKMVDITNGEIGRCHVHKILLKKHQASKLKMYLWHFDPRFKVLTRINVDDSVEYPLVAQLPSPDDDSDKETMKRFQRKAPKSGIRRPPQWETEQGLLTTSQVCSCRISCRSVRCSCVKAAQKCSLGRSVCLCSNCDNPLNILDSLGIEPRLAVLDSCLFHNIYQIIHLRTYLCREVKLECCNSYTTIQDCIPSTVLCPNSQCMASVQYSWCGGGLCDVSLNPRNHCSVCGRCCFSSARHCAQCNKCYNVTSKISFCPKCKDKIRENVDDFSDSPLMSPYSPGSPGSAPEMDISTETSSRNDIEEIVIEN